MIKFKDISVDIIDPEEDIKSIGVFKRMEIWSEFENKNFDFILPEHIVENKDKKIYKAGFLNDCLNCFSTGKTKKSIFEFITKEFDIFVDERQYQNLVRDYKKKKYSFFIQK
jgi:hypothetical protein